MNVLIISGWNVHRMYGRKHMLVGFFGGGLAGNLGQYTLYLYQEISWKGIFPSLKDLVSNIFGESLGSKLGLWQQNALERVYSSVNGWIPCVGASAAIASLLSIEACSSVASLVQKFRRLQHMRPNDFSPDFAVETMCEFFKITLTVLIAFDDAKLLIGLATKPKGVVGTLVAYAEDSVGHAAHLGGFLFGLLYYVFVLSKVPPRNSEVW